MNLATREWNSCLTCVNAGKGQVKGVNLELNVPSDKFPANTTTVQSSEYEEAQEFDEKRFLGL